MELFNLLSKDEEIYQSVKDNFNIRDCVIGKLKFGSDIPVIFIQFKDLKELDDGWKDFNSFITAEYLMKLKDDFSRWNSYIFFLASGQLDKALKYAIENNKFSTRKIVIESTKDLIDVTLIGQILSEHIINDNIKFEVTKRFVKEFKKDGAINKSLKLASLDVKEIHKEQNLIKVLNHLESLLNDEN